MPQLPGLPPPGFSEASAQSVGLPGLPPPGFSEQQPSPQPQGEARPAWKDSIVSAAQGATFGLADEAAAGARQLVPDSLRRAFGYEPFQDYDTELAAIRAGQKDFAERRPYLNAATGIAGSLALPVGGLAARGTTLAGKAALAGTEGAAMGAAYGFGSGEGGFENRLEKAGGGALVGGAVSPALVGGAEVLRRGLSGASNSFLKQAMNVQRSDIQKAAKFQRKGATGESPLISALRSAREQGIIKAGDDASSSIAKNEEAISKIGDEVTSILKQADAAQTNVTIPAFSRAQKFVNSSPYQKEELGNQLARRLKVIDDVWDGSVSGANELKQQLYKIAYKNTTDSAGLDKAIAADLKEFVETEAEQLLGSGISGSIKQLNAKQGEMLTLRDLLQKNRALEEMPGGMAKALRRAAVSPIGGSALGVGLTGLGVVNPSVGAVAALAAAAATKRGQLTLSDTAQSAANIVGARMNSAPKVLSAGVAATQSSPESEQNRSTKKQTLTPTTQIQRLRQAQTGEAQLGSGQRLNSPSYKKDIGTRQQIQQALSQVPAGFRDLAAAMIQVESSGDPGAVSKKGARGVMQLMPDTAKELGVTNPHDIGQNVAGGVKYVQKQLNKYGDLALALSAYNFGPGALDKAIAKAGTSDYRVVRNYLPRETREYVDKVTAVL